MRNTVFAPTSLVIPVCLLLAACRADQAPTSEAAPAMEEAPAAAATAATAAPTSFPASLRVVGDGYPNTGDPCRRIGESEATVNWLDDSADLVGCLNEADANALGGTVVGNVEGVTLVSVPRGQAGAVSEAPVAGNAAPPSKDMIRGKGGLEEKCLAQVGAQGTRVIGTNRIDESEAAIVIFVNVEGGSAPWRCVANRDGTISEVSFTGDEGAL